MKEVMIEDEIYEVFEVMKERYNLNSISEVIWQMTHQMKNHRLKLFDDEDSAQRVDLSSVFPK